MRLLLDTHVFLWWQADSPRLGKHARRAVLKAEAVFVSAVSAWEVAVKSALGKLRLPAPFEQAVEDNAMEKLPLQFSHAAALTLLAPHHADPFDRMLLAQARVEGLVLVTADAALAAYGIPLLNASK